MFTSPTNSQNKTVIRLSANDEGQKDAKSTLADLSTRLKSFEFIPFLKSTFSRAQKGQNALTRNGRLDQLNMLLTLILIIVVILSWRYAPTTLASVDQLKNDISEQAQVIKMEEQNSEFLVRLADDRNDLLEKLNTIYSAVPDHDEEAETIISILEDIGLKNQVILDSIGIRLLTENQFYHDELVGVVQPYQYTFSMETGLPNIMGFIGSIRSSRRLMDVMALDIEETDQGVFRASMTVNAYHLVE